jgi:hypothetical protein
MSNTLGTTRESATGGTITYYPWGLVHKAGTKYTGSQVEKTLDKTEL